MSRRLVALAIAAALACACGTDPTPSAVPIASAATGSPATLADDPAAPIVVTGRFVDGAGIPVPNAAIDLRVMDIRHSQIGQSVPLVFSAETRTGLDGSFRFRLVVPADLRRFAKANDDYINFDLMAIPAIQDPDQFGFWSFSRHLASTGLGFDDEAPTIVLRPLGPPPAAP